MVLVPALAQIVKPLALVQYAVGSECPDVIALRRLYPQHFSPEFGQHRGAVAAGIALVAQVQDGYILQGFGPGVGDGRVILAPHPVRPGSLFLIDCLVFLLLA
ncbi:hypothetical protein ES703_122414 [subsurface metagenome]